MSPLSASSGYDQALSSAYSTGSTSPISPQDTANALHRTPYPFSNVAGISPTSIENGHPAFNDLLDRRNSTEDHFNDFGINGFGAASQSRFPSDFGPSSSSAMMRQKHASDMFRHIAPQATHGFKVEPTSNTGFQDGYQYAMGNPQADLPLRLPVTTMGVDETLSRMKLQSHPGQGGTDLQSFIR